MTNRAAFTIEGSASGPHRGYDAFQGEPLALQLEQQPSSVIACVFSCPVTSKGAAAPEFANGGVASPPGGAVTCTIPSTVEGGGGWPATVAHSFLILCTVTYADARGVQHDTFARLAAVRDSAGGRKIVKSETIEYDPETWVEAVNDVVAATGTIGSADVDATPDTLVLRDGVGSAAVLDLQASTLTSATGAWSVNAVGNASLAAVGSVSNLDLICGSGSALRCYEGATHVASLSDEANVSTVALQGSSGGNITSPANTPLNISAGAGASGQVVLRNGTTNMLAVTTGANTSYMTAAQSGGAVLRATAGQMTVSAMGNLDIKVPSGSVARIYEGSTLCASFSDAGSYNLLDLGGHGSGSAIIQTQYMSLVGASYATIQSPIGSQRFFGSVSATSLYAGANGDTTSPTAPHTREWLGTGGARAQKDYYGTRLTTDATLTTVLAIPIPSGGAQIRIQVVAFSSSGDVGSYTRSLVASSDGVAANILDEVLIQEYEDSSVWSVSTTTAAEFVRIQVTGEAATPIRWECHATVYLCAKPV